MSEGGFAPNYAWIGAPAEFNSTNALTGGDSCESTISFVRFAFLIHVSFPLAPEIRPVPLRVAEPYSIRRGGNRRITCARNRLARFSHAPHAIQAKMLMVRSHR